MIARVRRVGAKAWAIGGILALAVGVPVAAQPVVFFPDQPYCAQSPGNRFVAPIWLDTDGRDVSCFHVYLTFDRSRLALVSVAEGDMFRLSGIPTFFLWEDQAADTTAFTDCLLGQGTSVSGIGEIVKLEFELTTCGAPTVSPLNLTDNRALPPPFQISFVTDENRQVISGVDFLDEAAQLCGSCATEVRDTAVPPAMPGIRLAPNPVGRELHLAWWLGGSDFGSRPLVFEVLDAAGRRQRMRSISGRAAGELTWDLGDGPPLPRGVYWLVLRSHDSHFVQKFVHER